MNRRLVVLTVAFAGLLALVCVAQAELTAGQKMAVEALIRQFSHRDFAVREQAVTRLIEIGPDVVPIIRKTLGETSDNEVKLRCEMVLKGVAAKYGTDVGLGKETPAKDWGLDASKITLKVQNVDLDRIIEAISEQSGNTLVRLPEAWAGKPLSLDVTDMPYWQVLDKLCLDAGLTYTVDYREGGLRLSTVEKPGDISAYAGPAVLKMESATRTRTFRTMTAAQPLQNLLNYRFTFLWEDRLDPIGAEAEVTSVTAPDGAALKRTEMPRGAFMGMRFGGGQRRTAAGQLFVNITDVPENLQKIAEISGIVTLTLGEGEKTLQVENALAEGEKSGKLDDTTLTVTDVNRRGGNWATLNVKMTVDGKEVPLPSYPYGSPYGFFLVDPNGGRHRGTAFGFSGFRQVGGGGGGRRNRGDGAAPAPGQGGGGRRGGGRRGREAPNAANENPGEVAAAVVQIVLAEEPGNGNIVVRREAGNGNIVVAQAQVVPAPPPGAAPANPGQAGPVNVRGGFQIGGRSSVSFTQLPEIEGAWTLLLVMPAKSTQKEFPFSFKDVPLP